MLERSNRLERGHDFTAVIWFSHKCNFVPKALHHACMSVLRCLHPCSLILRLLRCSVMSHIKTKSIESTFHTLVAGKAFPFIVMKLAMSS